MHRIPSVVVGSPEELVQRAVLCATGIPGSTAVQAENNVETQPILEKFTNQEPEER